MPDHVHVLLRSPKHSVASVMGYLKGRAHDDIRQARQPQVQVRQQEVLGGGGYVSTVG